MGSLHASYNTRGTLVVGQVHIGGWWSFKEKIAKDLTY